MIAEEIKNSIIVYNIAHNELIHYSLLLLKGKVHHENCTSNKECALRISVRNDETTADFKATKLNNFFKCLVELKSGDNSISLSYCCVRTDLNVKYLRRKSKYEIVPLYIINEDHDGKFQAPEAESNSTSSACDRIVTGCKLLQCFLAAKLKEDGFGRKTFQLDLDRCLVFRSKLNFKAALKMKQNELWTYLGKEIMTSSIGDGNKKYLGFLSCTKYNGNMYSTGLDSHDDVVRMTEGYVALGGGGLALFGSACLYTWPQNVDEVLSRFDDRTEVDKTKFMDDSCYRGTLSACFSTTLGSVLHELCHTFDLGHTEVGIMGRGFDDIDKFFIDCPNSIDVTIRQLRNSIIRNPSKVNKNCCKRSAEDLSYFTQNCAALLSYHKFFNEYEDSRRNFLLNFDRITRIVKSTAGLRVVEIRSDADEMVVEYWTFVERVLKYTFEIPRKYFSRNLILVVEDDVGNILKDSCTSI